MNPIVDRLISQETEGGKSLLPRTVSTVKTRVFVTLSVLMSVIGLAVMESLSEPHLSPTGRFFLGLFHLRSRSSRA